MFVTVFNIESPSTLQKCRNISVMNEYEGQPRSGHWLVCLGEGCLYKSGLGEMPG